MTAGLSSPLRDMTGTAWEARLGEKKKMRLCEAGNVADETASV
jgi:hypothetical protein